MNASGLHTLPLARARRETFRPRYWIPALQVAADVLALECALLLGIVLRDLLRPWFSVSLAADQVEGIALGLLVVPFGHLLVGLYPGYGLAAVERLRRRVRADFYVFAGLLAWGYLVHRERWSRGVLLATFLLALLLSPLVERLLIRRLERRGWWGAAVVVFGTGANAHHVAERMRGQPNLGLVPIAVVEVENTEVWTGPSLAAVVDWHLRSAGQVRARIAVLALPALSEHRRLALVETLPFRCLILLSDVSHIQTQSVTAVDIGGSLGLALNRNLLIPWNRWLKRALDLACGSLLLLLGAPVVACSALALRILTGGPAFYSHERLGARGRPIRIWKLRTMHTGADQLLAACLERDPGLRAEWERTCKLRHDPRVIPGIGRFLRRTSLDELPQLWNVVRGEMSLVGPRPFPRYHLERFDADFIRLRECIRPGLTGLWQVSARSDSDLASQRSLDTYYIRNWSLWLDIEIALRTVSAVTRGRGAY